MKTPGGVVYVVNYYLFWSTTWCTLHRVRLPLIVGRKGRPWPRWGSDGKRHLVGLWAGELEWEVGKWGRVEEKAV